MKNVIWALGIMSGTSMDGIDAAMISTDGESIQNFGRTYYQAYTDQDRRKIANAVQQAQVLPTEILMHRDAWPQALTEAETFITDRHIDLIQELKFKPDVIGIHGQTLIHRPENRFSLQIIDGQRVANETGLRVVYNLRAKDIAHGGQGAPLVPFYHFALAKRARLRGPVAFLNVGGVGNVTWVNPECDNPDQEGALLAFDTGTGMALLNDWVLEKANLPYDADGLIASQGCVDASRLRQWSQTAYFDMQPPKSLDRDEFKRLADVSGLSIEDGAATLTAFSAYGVERALEWMPAPPVTWFVCGGGRQNSTLLRMLKQRLQSDIRTIEDIGIDGDQVEAQAFAYLAVRSLLSLPLSSPETTRCERAVTGGVLSIPQTQMLRSNG